MHNSYRLFYLTHSVPFFFIPSSTCRSAVRKGGEKKEKRKRDCGGKRRKIEHPALFCQSTFSVKHCSACRLLWVVQEAFHLTWLCKRFSPRPKGSEWHRLDKVPCLPAGPCCREEGLRWRPEPPLNTWGGGCRCKQRHKRWVGKEEQSGEQWVLIFGTIL